MVRPDFLSIPCPLECRAGACAIGLRALITRDHRSAPASPALIYDRGARGSKFGKSTKNRRNNRKSPGTSGNPMGASGGPRRQRGGMSMRAPTSNAINQPVTCKCFNSVSCNLYDMHLKHMILYTTSGMRAQTLSHRMHWCGVVWCGMEN